MKERRKRLHLQRIQNNEENWLEDERDIAAETVNVYHNQFSQERDATPLSLLRHIQKSIWDEDNAELCRQPNLNEVKRVVFELNGDNASGPDGLIGRFYQSC